MHITSCNKPLRVYLFGESFGKRFIHEVFGNFSNGFSVVVVAADLRGRREWEIETNFRKVLEKVVG
jgi:hypothetical protein